jgi:diguanylate cyclase (GGDEF)-like protein/PAS domain S-box-containing protein
MDAAAERPSADDRPERLLIDHAAILEGLPDAVVAAASDGRIVFVNGLAEELFGYPRAEVVGRPVQVLWPERVRERYTDNMRLYFATEHPLRFSTEAWGLRRDGSEFVGEMSWGIVNTTAGPLLLAIGRDISDRLAAEERLRAVAALGERALAGADPADLAADAVELMRSKMPIEAAEVRLADGGAVASSGPPSEAAIRLPIAAGDELVVAPRRELADEEMNLVRAVASILATALARRRSEERMRHDALHDPLTGLANRTLLGDRLEQALARSRRQGRATAVLFVDLDNFKAVNDTHGHAAGDAVLVEIGRRLRKALRPADTVARLGGDEFVTVCEATDQRSALMLGRRLQEAIQLPLRAGAAAHRLSASIGISLGDNGPDVLLNRADAAAYHAKSRGGGCVEFSLEAHRA